MPEKAVPCISELTELHWMIMGEKFPLALTSGVQTQQACIHHSVAPQGRLSEKKVDCEVTEGSVPVNLLVGGNDIPWV